VVKDDKKKCGPPFIEYNGAWLNVEMTRGPVDKAAGAVVVPGMYGSLAAWGSESKDVWLVAAEGVLGSEKVYGVSW